MITDGLGRALAKGQKVALSPKSFSDVIIGEVTVCERSLIGGVRGDVPPGLVEITVKLKVPLPPAGGKLSDVFIVERKNDADALKLSDAGGDA